MLDFTNFLCFRINALSRRISRLYNNRCLEYGITASQSFVIFDVMNHEGTSVRNIAERIQLDSPAITGLIDRLVKEKLIERKEDPQDRRSLKIYLTPKGRELAETKLVPMANEFNEYIKNTVDPNIVNIFKYSLDLMDMHLKKASVKSSTPVP